MEELMWQRLTALLGTPDRSTKKAHVWQVRPGFEVLLERGVQAFANCWLPASHAPTAPNAVMYAAGQGRHSATYTCPSMREGSTAVCLTLRTTAEVDAAADLIASHIPPRRQSTR
ncbi:MAG: hypothetical protein IT303_18655 [Dehalococcoidia bacterium]|nr:hypothetical protein [Dehalococcoidia bacterium]